MSRHIGLLLLAASIVGIVGSSVATAQEKKAPPAPTGFRKLAAGVEVTIAPKLEADDTFSLHKFSELLAYLPAGDADTQFNYEPKTASLKSIATGGDGTKPGAGYLYHSDVWYLEFTFRPLRTIAVDVPKSDGRLERKVVW